MAKCYHVLTIIFKKLTFRWAVNTAWMISERVAESYSWLVPCFLKKKIGHAFSPPHARSHSKQIKHDTILKQSGVKIVYICIHYFHMSTKKRDSRYCRLSDLVQK